MKYYVIGRVTAVIMALMAGILIAGPPQAAQAAGPMPAWQLPFENGQTWRANGPHHDQGNTGTSATWGSLDFGPSGANRRVVSIARGTVYKVTCGAAWYLGIDHGNGWRSTYYHLTNQQAALVGKQVDAGTYLGDAGRATPCGGSASADHVHLTIRKDNAYTSVNGFQFGNYRVYASSGAYLGTWKDLAGNTIISVPSTGYMTGSLTSTTRSTPTTPPPPVDSDNDDVPDSEDRCPTLKGPWGYSHTRGWVANRNGSVSHCGAVGTGNQVRCDTLTGTKWTTKTSPATDL